MTEQGSGKVVWHQTMSIDGFITGPDQPNLSFVCGDIPEIIAKARAAADGGDVIVTGADVARQCVEAGQVDELLVHVVPVLLGAGIRIFDRTGTGWFTLEPVGIARAGNVYDMRYRFIR